MKRKHIFKKLTISISIKANKAWNKTGFKMKIEINMKIKTKLKTI